MSNASFLPSETLNPERSLPKAKTMLEAALAYTAQGIPVFPCHENSKVPATTNGFYDATCDELTIIGWFTENPNYNLAMCPEDAGLCVGDVDTKNGKRGIESWNALGIKVKTRTVRTPSGGLHHIFKGSLPATAGKLGDGIDTRGQRSYVLLPPSVIDGKRYEVIDDRDPIELPAAIKEALKKSVSTTLKASVEFEIDSPRNVARAVEYLKHACAAIEFEGSDAATVIIANAVGDLGVSQDTALELMCEHWVPRCVGRWTDDWLNEKIRSAYRSRQNEIGCHAVGDIPEAWVKYAAQQFNDDDAQQVETYTQDNIDSNLVKFFRGREPDEDENLPDITFLDAEKTIPIEIEGGCCGVMYGDSGSQKTTVALADAFTAIGKGKRVVFGAGEGAHGVRKSRVPAYCRDREMTTKDLRGKFRTCPTVPNLTSEIEVASFIEAFRDFKPDIIYLDTLCTASGGVDENSDAIGKLLTSNGAVGKIRRAFNCTVVLIHHSGKDDSRGARGHSSIECNADAMWKITVDKAARVITKRVEKLRDAEDGFCVEYHLTPPQQVPVARVIGRINSIAFGESEDLLGMATASLQRAGIDSESKAIATPGLARLMLELEFPNLRGEEGRALTDGQKQRQAALEQKLKRAAKEERDRFSHLCKKLGKAKTSPWMWSLPYHDKGKE